MLSCKLDNFSSLQLWYWVQWWATGFLHVVVRASTQSCIFECGNGPCSSSKPHLALISVWGHCLPTLANWVFTIRSQLIRVPAILWSTLGKTRPPMMQCRISAQKWKSKLTECMKHTNQLIFYILSCFVFNSSSFFAIFFFFLQRQSQTCFENLVLLSTVGILPS